MLPKRLILCLILILSTSCERIFDWLDDATTVYENSFESADDAAGWEGVTAEIFVNDPAPGSGERSLNIGGGCIQPAATLTLPDLEQAGFYRLACWGKVEEEYNGGSIKLISSNNEIEIRIDQHDWTKYEPDDRIFCAAGSRLTIELWIGGIVSDFMKLDALKIIRE